MDANQQLPGPGTQTSDVAIGGTGCESLLTSGSPDRCDGPTSLTQTCVSLLAESASDTEEETGTMESSTGMCTYTDGAASHLLGAS